MNIDTNHAPMDMACPTCLRNVRTPVNNRGGDWDCVRQMQMFRHRPDCLARALRDMGVTESGDEVVERPT